MVFMGRLNNVKMASFLYGLIKFYKDAMETLYNVLVTLLFCLLKTLLERFPSHSEDVFIYKYAESAYEANI